MLKYIDLLWHLSNTEEAFYNTEESPPIQTIEIGLPRIDDVYWTGVKWLPLIGRNTPVWINSSDPESGSHYIMYKVFWSLTYGTWTGGDWITVYDQDVSSDPRYQEALNADNQKLGKNLFPVIDSL